jgi:hypothetical protein
VRTRHLVALTTLTALAHLGFTCGPPAAKIVINSPASNLIESCDVEIAFTATGPLDLGTLEASLNFEPLVVTGGPVYTATIDAEDDLLLDNNVLLVRAERTTDGQMITSGLAFAYLPNASAYPITDPADLIEGPLAHGRVGDYMLANCRARFVIQDAGQRDFYSVGAFGGNIIDAELVSTPGLDNFIEIQPMLNIETVINAVSIEILNDGSNGEPAAIRTCGPDDLLDFVNPSSQIAGISGVTYPPQADDTDLPIEACTVYSLAPRKRYVKMETTVENLGGTALGLFVGDWINAGGEVENYLTPGMGLGSGLTGNLNALSFPGFGEATGIDYGYTTTPALGLESKPSQYLNTSGVTIVFHNADLVFSLLGVPPPFTIGPGANRSFTRYLGVGDGAGSNAIDMENEIKELAVGSVEGCVTVGGLPAPGARVSVGNLVAGEIDDVYSSFVTDADGCYSGTLPSSVASYGAAVARAGTLYEGGALDPPVMPFSISEGTTTTLPTVELPESATLIVNTTDEGGSPTPARVSVVGFDPSPEPIIPGGSVFGLSSGDLGLFNDPTDSTVFGITQIAYTDASGAAVLTVEPGSYQVFVSRGSEYSLFDQAVTLTGGLTTVVNAQIARVIETPGFVSSDFHVHGINSADSRVSHTNRVMQFAGEGVENVIMTDHHVHTDLRPRITELGMGAWLTASIGEEMTTFDYGHFNAYPQTIDANRPSGGSVDWAGAAPAGMDFPAYGHYSGTPAEIYSLATTGPQSLPGTVVQVNHIDSHFEPLKIDTSVSPISDGLSDAERTALRLEIGTGNLFHYFDGLELWNGDSRGAQSGFLDECIGIWFNHLNQGLDITFIADTDTHAFRNLNSAGARTWTASPTDAPSAIASADVAAAVAAGRAVGGQGAYLQTRLLAQDGSGDVADLTLLGSTMVASSTGDVDLEITVQTPAWAEYDTIEIYANAATTPAGNDYVYSAVPTLTKVEGLDFSVSSVVVNAGIPGATRLETRNYVVPFVGLTDDTWFVVVVKGSDGVSRPMFPVFPDNLNSGTNTSLADLLDGNLGESGVMALGASNALYADVDGTPGIQMPPLP